jgi:hypothetical protein
MRSSLLNEPLPDHIVHRYDLMARDPLHADRDEAEMKARIFYLEKAAAGDPEAKLMLKVHPTWHLKGWYSKAHGDILGEHLAKVVREREHGNTV